MHKGARHTILLVEADPSLRRMMALGLQYRGLRVIEAASPADFSDVDKHGPDLVLLDIDGAVGNGAQALAEIQSYTLLASLPIVLLAWGESVPADAGWILGQGSRSEREGHPQGAPVLPQPPLSLQRDGSEAVKPTQVRSVPAVTGSENTPVRFASMAKPFDARALYDVIESLLASESASLAIQQEPMHPTYASAASYSPSPSSATLAAPTAPAGSAAPMVTAVGLLLAFTGVLLQITITVVGLLIVIAALLWWTLGTKPEHLSVAR